MSVLENDLRLATQALDQGDLRHAARHAAGAVAAAPVDPRVTALVDRLAGAGEAALDAVPITAGVFHGMAALRGLLLHRHGHTAECIQLLWPCLVAAPTVDYVSCIERCLEAAQGLEQADGKTLCGGALRIFERLPRAAQIRAADLLVKISDRIPDDDWAFFAACLAVRKSGRATEAVELGATRVGTRPGPWAYVALAGARRECGDDEGAVDAYRSAALLAPDDPSCLLDCGDVLLGLRRPADALKAYEQAVERAPGHPWAYPSVLFLRAQAGHEAAGAELLELARTADAPPRARELATELAPVDVDLPKRHDACLALADEAGDDRPVSVASSSLEAPSAYRVLRLLCGPELEISAHVPRPDPRIPRGRVPFVLWRYGRSGWRRLLGAELPLEAEPAVEAAWPEAAEPIAALARQPYSRGGWWQRAAGIVQVLGEATRPTALSCMVHWPSPPEGVRRADAAFRVQVASAYVLARGGHRDALVAILHGPVDWIGTAALVGLTELAVREHDHAAAELVLATALDDEINPIRWQCLIEPATLLSGLLPGIAPETATRIAARRKEAEEAE